VQHCNGLDCEPLPKAVAGSLGQPELKNQGALVPPQLNIGNSIVPEQSLFAESASQVHVKLFDSLVQQS
jgi:hypothetical protein